MGAVKDSVIHGKVMGSDHCPIELIVDPFYVKKNEEEGKKEEEEDKDDKIEKVKKKRKSKSQKRMETNKIEETKHDETMVRKRKPSV